MGRSFPAGFLLERASAGVPSTRSSMRARSCASPRVPTPARILYDDTATLASIELRQPPATLALASAHDLTDAIPFRIDIALQRGSRRLKKPNSPIRWHSFDAATFAIGRETIEPADCVRIGVYGSGGTVPWELVGRARSVGGSGALEQRCLPRRRAYFLSRYRGGFLMRKVTYSMGVSLDGYIVGPDGKFDWTAPDKEVFRFCRRP